MTRVVFKNAVAPLLVLAVSCLAAASVLAQQRPVPGAAFGGSRGSEDDSAHQPASPNATPLAEATVGPTRSTAQWLTRLRQAAHAPAYTGTYVVWSVPGMLVSSRIWHASSKGDIGVERVDALSGEPRSTYRITGPHGSKVKTFLLAQRVLRIDHSDTPSSSGGFPNLPDAGQDLSPANYYDVRQGGQERVAGFAADVVQFVPRDNLRYGYRVWSEQRTGLAIKLQTLSQHGRVLEQAAFSGLTFDAPVNAETLLREMHHHHGWQVKRVVRIPTTATAEGWQIGGPTGQPAPGFALQRCYRQPAPVRAADVQAGDKPASDPAAGDSAASRDQAAPLSGFQCVFSDGLAAVSVFIEPYDAARHPGDRAGPLNAVWGATHLLARRVGDTGWVTVVGEVPLRTLNRFIAGVSRLP
ncbi:MAG: MucB/RseB C-terminal domain-containing protein [Burkholderiaceae bacterium]|nr:MucB/RseB C-terminal domain-containing protein [Burkholderiaceae bacterium]